MVELLENYRPHRSPRNWYGHRAEPTWSDLRHWTRRLRQDPKPIAKLFRPRRSYDWTRVRVCRPEARLLELVREVEFQELVQQWKTETQFLSVANQKFLVPSYQRIIGLGPRAIPMILRELQDRPDHWFWALAAVTGRNPVPPESVGNFAAIRTAWLDWGREQGYL